MAYEQQQRPGFNALGQREYALQPSPLRNRNRDSMALNPQSNLSITFFIPPTITDEQVIIRDRQVGVAVQSVEILDAIANGSIAVLGTGRLVII